MWAQLCGLKYVSDFVVCKRVSVRVESVSVNL